MKRGERILLAHNHVPENAGPEDQDTLHQALFVAGLLAELGHTPLPVATGDDLAASLQGMSLKTGASLAVNLVESVAGSCRDAWRAAPLLLEQGLACTGSDGAALMTSTNKLLARHVLQRAGLPVPEAVDSRLLALSCKCHKGRVPGSWIVKSVWEHASLGLDASSVLQAPLLDEFFEILALKRAQYGGHWFAEAYVEGREFNLSLLEFDGGVQALPPAEMCFVDWEQGRPRIVDHDAKWCEDDPAYENTTRSFRFSEAESGLLRELAKLALGCWDAFGLSGYARVDFRVDAQNRPWIIDVNANPCLAPDGGFMAALHESGLGVRRAMERILEAARKRGGGRL